MLKKNRDLHLCLAHFGGNTSDGRKWGKQIIELIKNYDNVYADISSSFANYDFRYYFRNTICKDEAFQKKIRYHILFGTDWYMTLMDKIEYKEYCQTAKEFLDEFDTGLWPRFTLDNPYRFYKLNSGRIERIAENIINIRLNDGKIRDAIGKFDPKSAEEIRKEAKYIRMANEPFTNYRYTFKV